MDKNYIISNWNNLYKSYIRLNPDLALHGINTKRSLLNHYITCGFKENRKIVYESENKIIIPSKISILRL